MENLKKRGLSLLLAFVMIVSLFAGIQLPQASAATVDYVYSGDYVYNWGTRGTTATFLSPMAEDWWNDNGATYSALASKSGSSNVDTVSTSALFVALNSLMATAQSQTTSYDSTRNLFQYTDCQNSAKTTTKISSFYSGTDIGPSWDSGSTWNREHVWPNSKSASGSDSNTTREQDIMMLRPTAKSENGDRGNAAYGESTGFYNPNTESGGTYDLRGDVSRIALYVYVRWGTTDKADGCLDYMWGSSGVIESKDILLKWMEADPVDTWELGRNDAVQSITGTRNVFVDYPELAFLLFAEEVPTGYSSPSGGDDVAAPSYKVTIKENGATTYDQEVSSLTLPTAEAPEGFEFVGYVTETVSETTAQPDFYEAGDVFHPTKDTTLYALYSRTETTSGGGSTTTTEITFNLGTDNSSKSNSENSTAKTTYTETASDYTLNLTNGVKFYPNSYDKNGSAIIKLGSGSAVGSFTIADIPDSVTKVIINIAGRQTKTTQLKVNSTTYDINTKSDNDQYTAVEIDTSSVKELDVTTVKISSGDYRAYMDSIVFVVESSGSSSTTTTYYTTSTCAHEDTENVTAQSATCTADGYTAGVYCNDCETYISGHEVIKSEGHDYESVVTPPTATEQGFTTHTCSVCSDSYVDNYLPALGEDFTVSFIVPTGVASVSPVTGNNAGVTLPTAEAPVGYTFVGWVTGPVNNVSSKPDSVYDAGATDKIKESITLYALYSYAKSADGGASESKDYTVTIAEYADATGWVNEAKYSSITINGNDLTASASTSGNTGKYYTNGENWRLYQTDNASLTITANAINVGTIKSITITYASSNTGILTYNDVPVESGTAVTINADSATFEVANSGSATNGQVRITKIEVTTAGASGITYYTTNICSHANTITQITNPTCGVNGAKTVTCIDCDTILSQETIDALTHTYIEGVCSNCGDTLYVTFVTPAGVDMVPAQIASGNVTLPTPVGTPTSDLVTDNGYQFIGWSETHFKPTEVDPDDLPTYYAAGDVWTNQESKTFYAVYTYNVTTEGDSGGSSDPVTSLVTISTYASANNWTNGGKYYSVVISDNVTATAASNGSNTGYASTSDWRIYQTDKGTLTFNATKGTISTIKITYSSSNNGVLQYNGSNVTSGTVVTVNAASAQFSVGNTSTKTNGQARITKIEVVFIPASSSSEPTTVTYHTTMITECEHSKTSTEVVDGYKVDICDSCGATISYIKLDTLSFSSASLELGEGISINFKVPAKLFAEGMYDLDSVVATFTYADHPEDSFTVTNLVLKNGYYVFQLKNIRPDWMGDVVVATLSAEDVNGETVTCNPVEYSVAAYCYNKLTANDSSADLKALLIDMLNYGAAAQIYTGYKTDALVTDNDAYTANASLGSTTTKPLTSVQGFTGEAGSVSWKGASLFLRETTRIRLRFAAEDVTGLTVVATVGGNSYELTNFISAGNGQYYVFFDNLLATQMRDNVEFTVMDGDAAVSKTLTYSVASYAAAVSESNTTLYNMIHAMMRYGDSVDVYAG